MTVNDTTADAKTAARQRIRAFLDARNAYAASLGHSGFSPDEITRQVDNGFATTFPVAPGQSFTIKFEGGASVGSVPLLASDLAILIAED